jgi:hypothetical protein
VLIKYVLIWRNDANYAYYACAFNKQRRKNFHKSIDNCHAISDESNRLQAATFLFCTFGDKHRAFLGVFYVSQSVKMAGLCYVTPVTGYKAYTGKEE